MPSSRIEDRLDDVRRAEYGSPKEVLARGVAVVVAAVSVSFLTGETEALIWLSLHLGLQGLLWFLLHRSRHLPPGLTYRAAIATYMLTALNFAFYPLHLLYLHETPALLIAATLGLMGQVTYILQRRHLEAAVVVVDTLTMTAVCLSVIFVMLPRSGSTAETALIVVCPLVLLGYSVVAQFSGMQQQKMLRDTQARYAASQKARALNQFVGGVAHDFNNQLTAILGHLELYDLLDDPEERRNALEESRRAAHRAALTVQQLLASSGRTRLSPVPVQMATFLPQLKAVLTELLDPGMQVSVTHPEETLSAWVDPDMLETCMIQLCLNAQDATLGHGHIRIWVETRAMPSSPEMPIEADPPYTVVQIEDDGPGVPPEALTMLAEPFYSTKASSEGAGLGLSAVSGFARQSGGALIITQPPARGLRLSLILPQKASANRFRPVQLPDDASAPPASDMQTAHPKDAPDTNHSQPDAPHPA